MKRIYPMNLSDVPIKHKYFFIKSVRTFLGFLSKRTPFMKEMHRILKFTNLKSSTFEKGFLCTSDRFFFIGGYIYFTKLFSISNASLIYHLSLILTKI